MKHLVFTLLIILFVSPVFSQTRKSSPATVETVSGIPFFIFSEPASEYEVVGKAMSFGNMLNMAVDEESGLMQKAKKVVTKALERKKAGKIQEFDAILINLDSEKMQVIKFKNTVSTDATVANCKDVPVYFFSKPVNDYETVATLPADYSNRAKRGLLFDKIRSMMKRTIEKEENGEVEHFDAVIINHDDLSETLIRFK